MQSEGKNVKIEWVEFENVKTGLKIDKVTFHEDVTLLVGLSGVGKSQILNAIEYSLSVAADKDIELKPFKVSLGICIEEDKYIWSYKIDSNKNDINVFEVAKQYEFVYEKLEKNNEMIFERNLDDISVVGYDKVPQPKRNESLILQYEEEKQFAKFISSIRKIHSVEMDLAVRGRISSDPFRILKNKVKEMVEKNNQLSFESFSHLPIPAKIYIAKEYYYEDIYVKIFGFVKELFMEIEDIRVVEDSAKDCFEVAINVYGNELQQQDISNGMLKTIYYIVELFTMSKNSLVLIDEFENGLGVNCIDVLSELLLSEREDLQFIITSHHPKIINGITQGKWKIIDRDGMNVSNKDSMEYGIGNSQHDAYFNLINRWEYEGKI